MQAQETVEKSHSSTRQKLFANPVIVDIIEKYRSIAGLNHSTSLMYWDMEVNMPEAGANARGVALAETALLTQAKTLALEPLLTKAEKQKDLNDSEKGLVRVLKRALDYYQKIPPSLVEALQKAYAEANHPWREARKTSNFQLFKPYLEKILELKKQEASKLSPSGNLYNGLADLFDEGITTTILDRVFGFLVPNLKKILGKATSEGRLTSSHPLEDVKYDTNAMRIVNDKLYKLLGMPTNRSRLDVSTHPFSSRIATDDVRVTTRYEGMDFKATMFSVIHECGHALYELQGSPELEFTPLAGGVSFGVHESQSRFWENIVGRNRDFTHLVYPILRENLNIISSYSEDSIYTYFNTVKTSLIRVDADELTYNFHIAMRYDLEKKMIDGKISIGEVPEAWNDTIENYLGKRPKNDAEGVLQDIHWSWGSFGYFPSYTLGNVVAGMLWSKLETDGVVKVENENSLKDYRNWLELNIHRWGGTYSPNELLHRIFGKEYDPEGLVKYLEDKYLAE
jgi:carboxypeptidase Taq